MTRYAAFLRGVSPMNAKMPEVKKAFEAAGFTNVATLLSSGNVVFDSRASTSAVLEKKADAAMHKVLGRTFMTFVHPVAELKRMLESDPYQGLEVAGHAKRVVTFLRETPAKLKLPIEQDGACILKVEDGIAFSAYQRSDKGPVFMVLLERTFGKEQTTRTWQTLEKTVAR